MGRKSRCALISAAAQFIEQLESRTLLAADGYGYTAAAHPVEAIHLAPGDHGVITLLSDSDDDAAPVDLGSNTFNFYGKTYTGDQTLFASSNALITFDTPAAGRSNSDLANDLPERAIAPLWDDWDGIDNLPGEVLSKLEDTGGSSAPDRLIIQWNVVHFPGSSPILFQAILQLNTAATPGNIIFNYIDLDTSGSDSAEGASATVGIKDIGAQGPNQILISSDSTNPLIGDGKAILIRDTATNQPHADAGPSKSVFLGSTSTLDASATTDPNQSAATLTYAWDLNNDGVFGETGEDATNGDEIGIHPAFSNNFPGSFPVTLRVTNNAGLSAFDTTTVTVNAIVPVANITAPATTIVAAVPATFTLTATPTNSTYGYTVKWGDNSTTSFSDTTGSGTPATHDYAQPGSYTVTVNAFNDFAESDPVTIPVTVGPRPNLQLTSGGILVVTTGSANDTITVDQSGNNARLNRNGTITTYALTDVKSLDIESGDGNDSINASLDIPQKISCGDGTDTITTGDANDTIDAGGGSDSITSGDGDDSITTGDGNDTITSGDGDDSITTGNGNDTIGAGAGNESIQTGKGNNHVTANAGTIQTGDGNDTIVGGDGGLNIGAGNGNDSITTGSGNDHIFDGLGADFIATGDGNDTIVTRADPLLNMGATIDGGAGDDAFDTIFAISIFGGTGNDVIGARQMGGPIDCGPGDDLVRVISDADHPAVVFGGDGNDKIFSTDGRDSLYGGGGRDTLYSGNNADLLSGNGGNDQLFGQGGNDRLYGGAGNDRLEGSGGNDRLSGGPDADLINGGIGTNASPHDDPLDQLLNIQDDLA
jgi:Ca2+-binding RTX toxin-like protein